MALIKPIKQTQETLTPDATAAEVQPLGGGLSAAPQPWQGQTAMSDPVRKDVQSVPYRANGALSQAYNFAYPASMETDPFGSGALQQAGGTSTPPPQEQTPPVAIDNFGGTGFIPWTPASDYAPGTTVPDSPVAGLTPSIQYPQMGAPNFAGVPPPRAANSHLLPDTLQRNNLPMHVNTALSAAYPRIRRGF